MPDVHRTRRDRCPGVLRPWPADDGLLVRLRLVGGRLPVSSLRALCAVAERYGTGRVHVTGRANLQLRGLPGDDGRLAPEVLRALEATGLLPSRTHELVRNIMVSPHGMVPPHGPGSPHRAAPPPGPGSPSRARADCAPVAAALDELLCAEPHRAALPGRFLFVLDAGAGDLLNRTCDLGIAALDQHTAQLRIGDGWGPLTPLSGAADLLAGFADEFLARRGDGPAAPWHVAELPAPLTEPVPPDPRLPDPAPPLPHGPLPEGGLHVPVPDDGLDRPAVDALAEEAFGSGTDGLVVTPWRGVLVPGGAQ